MILSFHPCFETHCQIILGDKGLHPSHLPLIRRAEAIILPQTCSPELYKACKESPALLFPNYDARFLYPGKLGQSLLFEIIGLPHPKTMRWNSVRDYELSFSGKKGGYPHKLPFFVKADRSHEAEGVFLVSDERSLESALAYLRDLENSGFSGFATQECIRTEGNVLRAVIVGKRIITYWKRPSRPGQMITTIGRGCIVDKGWREDLQDIARAAALQFSKRTGANLAAVDFVFSSDQPSPLAVFLEINYYFGRRGLGGSKSYYQLLYEAIVEWLIENKMDPQSVKLV